MRSTTRRRGYSRSRRRSAGDLRVVIAVLSIIIDLECMGDHAKGIRNIVQMMVDDPLVKPLIDIPEMANRARAMLANPSTPSASVTPPPPIASARPTMASTSSRTASTATSSRS